MIRVKAGSFFDHFTSRTMVNYDQNSDVLLFNGGKAYKPNWVADSLQLEVVSFESDIAGSIPIDASIIKGKGYAVLLSNTLAYPAKQNSDGTWTSLAGIDRSGNGRFRVIQNENYALFIVNRIAYVYEKDAENGYILSDTLFNDAEDLAFLKPDVAILSTVNAKYICDLKARTVEESWYDVGGSFGVGSMTVDTSGLIMVATLGKVFNSRDFIHFEADTVGGFDYPDKIKFLNGHFWLSGGYKIYRLEDYRNNKADEIVFEAIYPNPVQDKLHFCLKSNTASAFSVTVYDNHGALVRTSDHPISEGVSELDIDLSALRSGCTF